MPYKTRIKRASVDNTKPLADLSNCHTPLFRKLFSANKTKQDLKSVANKPSSTLPTTAKEVEQLIMQGGSIPHAEKIPSFDLIKAKGSSAFGYLVQVHLYQLIYYHFTQNCYHNTAFLLESKGAIARDLIRYTYLLENKELLDILVTFDNRSSSSLDAAGGVNTLNKLDVNSVTRSKRLMEYLAKRPEEFVPHAGFNEKVIRTNYINDPEKLYPLLVHLAVNAKPSRVLEATAGAKEGPLHAFDAVFQEASRTKQDNMVWNESIKQILAWAEAKPYRKNPVAFKKVIKAERSFEEKAGIEYPLFPASHKVKSSFFGSWDDHALQVSSTNTPYRRS